MASRRISPMYVVGIGFSYTLYWRPVLSYQYQAHSGLIVYSRQVCGWLNRPLLCQGVHFQRLLFWFVMLSLASLIDPWYREQER